MQQEAAAAAAEQLARVRTPARVAAAPGSCTSADLNLHDAQEKAVRARHVSAAHETTKANEALQRYKEEQRLLDAQADAAIAGGTSPLLSSA